LVSRVVLQNQQSSDEVKMQKRLNTTQSARYLGISRQTLSKLAKSTLPPDGQEANRRPYWLQQTLDHFRAGIDRQKPIALVLVGGSLDGVGFQSQPRALPLLEGMRLERFEISAGLKSSQLIEVVNEISRTTPAALILPLCSPLSPYAAVVADLCSDLAVTVMLQPQQL
jgi:hypothetical protein